MKIPFWKMHGAANDFILVDDRNETFPSADKAWIERIAARRTGVGCEGLLLIQKSQKADFRMRFFNPDGSEVDMCGNGARCISRLARDLGAAPDKMSIETPAGILHAEALADGNIKLRMTDPKDWRMDRTLDIDGTKMPCGFVNTGVPHVVTIPSDLDRCDVQKLGAAIRYHKDFAPAGTNANFIQITGPQSLRVRTYERGVEGETLACGTGMVACALVASRLGKVRPPVQVTPASGDHLVVDFDGADENILNVTLLGPAVHVFQGNLEY